MHARPALRFGVFLVCVSAVLAMVWTGPAARAAGKTLVVEAGDQDRVHVPMAVDLPDGPVPSWMSDGSKHVPCQAVDGQLCFILDDLAAGKTATFTLVFGKSDMPERGVTLQEKDKTVEIAIAGKPFTVYHFTNPKYAGQQLRRPYFFPVYGPDQTTMTRPYPLTDEPIPDNVAKHLCGPRRRQRRGQLVHRRQGGVDGAPRLREGCLRPGRRLVPPAARLDHRRQEARHG